ncbi:MAG: cytoplasmic protein [Desulfohalobiaceae bacterium]
MSKIALFVYNGEPMCFVHVLLNCLDMADKGDSPEIVVEGASVKLLPDLALQDHHLNGLWEKVKARGLVGGVCRACSTQMGTLEEARSQGLTILEDMYGHPGMAGFRERGYEIVTF